MPYDGLKTEFGLADACTFLGITPIPAKVLRDHKAAELAKHPGSWWYYRQSLVAALLLFSFVASVFVFVIGIAKLFSISANGLYMMLGSAFTIWCLLKTRIGEPSFRAPADWKEYYENEYIGSVPPTILAMAEQIVGMVPNTYLVVGELTQNRVQLDPYLVVRGIHESNDFDEARPEVVLGIWDDNGVIHQASQN